MNEEEQNIQPTEPDQPPQQYISVEANPKPKSNLPNAKDALIVFAIFIAVSLVYSRIRGIYGTAPPTTALGLLYVLFFSHILGMIAPVIIYIKWKKYDFRATLGLRSISIPILLLITLLGLILTVGLGILQMLLQPLFHGYEKDMIDYQNFFVTIARASKSRIDIFLFIAVISAIPAFAEEILFRGLILSGLRNSSTVTKAVVISGLLFGVIHMFPPQMLAISILGIFFGILIVRTKSIVSAIWCHFLNNFLMIVAMIFIQT